MFNIFKKKLKEGSELRLKIEGMHCTSCALTIDDTMEETKGVLSSVTTYAKSITTINYNPVEVTKEQLHQVIKKLGYTSSES